MDYIEMDFTVKYWFKIMTIIKRKKHNVLYIYITKKHLLSDMGSNF